MQIILSHEQTDFDAVGAMLAAYLLSDQSQPVLPNKINRNVRNFLNLYGFELPFVEFRDLPSKPIQSITLVDTQSLVTLKGASKKTQIHVVDHHRGRDDLPVKWSYTFEKVGATTTILVDQLQKQGESLTMIQATLLLLGIYEDTGSLTYVSTTVRDIQAAAFLLESGANLQIAADFLNPALSKGQKILADRLMEDYQIVSIHGKNIFIACADGKELNEEISSIAHKLRDLFDPDALFLLVITNEGIRMVARSTTEAVNVGKIAGVFGGGGHERASAALIDKDLPQNLPELTEHLIRELKKAILPSITVGKIMSKRPLLISPNTSLAEAELLTQKYGYEGYPVVDDGRVIGLLTRRAVDRALSHKLNINAGSLMEAGDFSVTPDQTLDQLQSLMATTGWGQIPVVDSSTQKIVGIVTRTDLLKNLTGQENAVTSPANYASLIEKALSAPRLALLKKIIQVSSQDQQGLYIVGGFVRDLIMEKPSKDFDIVIEGDALKLAQALAGQYGGRVISHRRFGTAKWQIKEIRRELFKNIMGTSEDSTDLPESLDLISARTEFYDRPSALPTVERSSIKLDLHRRDFTINTLALRLDGHHFGELHDYWGGIADLQKKQIKVLHSLSFVDDPTRLLRAVRFAIRFDFKIETRTLQLMEEARSMLNN
jgi:tRNA nucleotidyltransferase (CCA-adding enzyme)